MFIFLFPSPEDDNHTIITKTGRESKGGQKMVENPESAAKQKRDKAERGIRV